MKLLKGNILLRGFDYYHVQNEDTLQVNYESQLQGPGGLCNIELVNIDKLTKTTKLSFSKDAPK